MGQRRRVAGGAGYLDRLRGQRPAARGIAGDEARSASSASTRARRGSRSGSASAAASSARTRSASTAPALAEPSPAVGEHGAAKPVRVTELLGERGGVEQRLAKLRVPDLALGLAEADQQLAAL